MPVNKFAYPLRPTALDDSQTEPAPPVVGTDYAAQLLNQFGDVPNAARLHLGGVQPLPSGMLERGNIDLHHRPVAHNPDGSISTVRSIGINDGMETLIPTVVGNQVVSNRDAIDEYRRTGKNLGKFSSVDASDKYAKQLHNDQAAEYSH